MRADRGSNPFRMPFKSSIFEIFGKLSKKFLYYLCSLYALEVSNFIPYFKSCKNWSVFKALYNKWPSIWYRIQF